LRLELRLRQPLRLRCRGLMLSALRVLRLPCRLLLARILRHHPRHSYHLHRLHHPPHNRLPYRPFDHNTEPWIKERWNSRERFS
jgi:hypothetical protein